MLRGSRTPRKRPQRLGRHRALSSRKNKRGASVAKSGSLSSEGGTQLAMSPLPTRSGSHASSFSSRGSDVDTTSQVSTSQAQAVHGSAEPPWNMPPPPVAEDYLDGTPRANNPAPTKPTTARRVRLGGSTASPRGARVRKQHTRTAHTSQNQGGRPRASLVRAREREAV